MERNRSIFKDIRTKVATAAALTLALSVACSAVQENNQNQAQALTPTPSAAGSTMLPPEVTKQELSVIRPVACPAGFGEVRTIIGYLATGLPDNQIKNLEEDYQKAKTSDIQGFYGEYESTPSSGASEYKPLWLVSKDGKEVLLEEGQANLCVSRSHLASLKIASSEIVKPADENIKWVGLISMNDGKLTSIPYYINVADPSLEENKGSPQVFDALFEVYDPRYEGNYSHEGNAHKINNLEFRLQQVDNRTSLSVPDTQHVFNVSFVGQ